MDTVSEKTSSTTATTSTHNDGVTEAAAAACSQLTSSSSKAAPIHCTAGQGDDNTDDLGEKQASPKQPALCEFPSKHFGSVKRSFSTYYYKNHHWLEYSVRKDAVFCFACRHFPTDSTEDAFRKGMSDWKRLSNKLEKHAKSQAHLNCMIKWDNFKASRSGSGSLAAELSQSHKATVEKNRKYLCNVGYVVRLLSKLGLPFRGHHKGRRIGIPWQCCLNLQFFV